MPRIIVGHSKWRIMKKLILLLLMLICGNTLATNGILETIPTNSTYNDLMSIVHLQPDNPETIANIERLIESPNVILLQNRYNLNEQDSFGRTAIWLAALGGKNIIYNYLLSIGADPEIRSTSGFWVGFSAKELHEMDPEEIRALYTNRMKEKLQ